MYISTLSSFFYTWLVFICAYFVVVSSESLMNCEESCIIIIIILIITVILRQLYNSFYLDIHAHLNTQFSEQYTTYSVYTTVYTSVCLYASLKWIFFLFSFFAKKKQWKILAFNKKYDFELKHLRQKKTIQETALAFRMIL